MAIITSRSVLRVLLGTCIAVWAGLALSQTTTNPGAFVPNQAGQTVNAGPLTVWRSTNEDLLSLLSPDEDSSPPRVSFVSPADGQIDVPLNVLGIEVQFNKRIDINTALGQNIYFTDSTGVVLGYANYYYFTLDRVRITFLDLLSPNSDYFVHVTTGVTDMNGQHLEQDFTSSFHTGPIPDDTTPPQVSYTTPSENQSASVSIYGIEVAFSKPIDIASAFQNSVFFTDQHGDVLGFANYYYFSRDRVRIAFSNLLPPESTFYIHVTTAIRDVAGNHLPEERIIPFSTASRPTETVPPSVAGMSPADASTDISVNISGVEVWFSEVIDYSTAWGNIFLADPQGNVVASVNYYYFSGDRMRVMTGRLRPGTRYSLHVTPAVRDVAGNSLVSEFVGSFTTEGRASDPVAQAGPDQSLECSGDRHATSVLDGSSSSDPDSTPGSNDDIVSFTWQENGLTFSTSEIATVSLALGSHLLSLTVTDHAGLTDSDSVSVAVSDTQSPSGGITYPRSGTCVGLRELPVTVSDDFTDICDPQFGRVYDPPVGPTYSTHGNHMVRVTATDSSGNSRSDSAFFVIDLVSPHLLLYPTPDRIVLDSAISFSTLFRSDDDDAADGGVILERAYWDNCLVFDGAQYGNKDGLLSDEVLNADLATFCAAINRCGLTSIDRPTVTIEATDCAGNAGSASRVMPLSPRVTASACHTFLRALPGPDGAASLEWNPVLHATSYDLIRGDVGALSTRQGAVTLGNVTCLGSRVPLTTAEDPAVPEAGNAFFYVMRYRSGTQASEFGWSTDELVRRPAAGGCPD